MAREKEKKKVKQETKSDLKIKLKAYDHKVLDSSCQQIIEAASRYNVKIAGPVPLPTEIHKYTVNRSTFIHEDSKEQFEVRIHKRLIEVENPNPRFIDGLTNLNLPAGIDIEIKM
jgi:small subunit ribosomal protein S10